MRRKSIKTTQVAGNKHANVRKEHSTETAQDYVEAIDDLIGEHGVCRLVEIARHFAVSHVTANRTVARLKRDGLVQSDPYGPITLTSAGKRLANSSRQRHEIVLNFLKALGVNAETAANDAEGIEHHVSQETLDAMLRFTAERAVVANVANS